jgi:hypothetical protein
MIPHNISRGWVWVRVRVKGCVEEEEKGWEGERVEIERRKGRIREDKRGEETRGESMRRE